MKMSRIVQALFAGCLVSSAGALVGCVMAEGASAGDPEPASQVDEASQALVVEHVHNPELSLPSGESLSSYLVPIFYNGDSSPIGLSLPFTSLKWHGFLTTPNNLPNDATLSSYFRFVTDAPGASDALVLSVSPGVSADIVQAFASYPGGARILGPSKIVARVMLLSGELHLTLANLNGQAKCILQTGVNTPRGVWTSISKDCPAPAPGDDHSMIVVGNAGSAGVLAFIDRVSAMEGL